MFIVLEGDNGSGKTTVSKLFEKDGFHIITNDSDVREKEIASKSFPQNSIERIQSFLSYNEYCGKKTTQYEKSLLVRYWVSTLAAAYSDYVLSKDDILKRASDLIKTGILPDLFIYLNCDYSVRIDRIEKRKYFEGELDDDISADRNFRYQNIILTLSEIIPNWNVISASMKSPEQIKLEIEKILQQRES